MKGKPKRKSIAGPGAGENTLRRSPRLAAKRLASPPPPPSASPSRSASAGSVSNSTKLNLGLGNSSPMNSLNTSDVFNSSLSPVLHTNTSPVPIRMRTRRSVSRSASANEEKLNSTLLQENCMMERPKPSRKKRKERFSDDEEELSFFGTVRKKKRKKSRIDLESDSDTISIQSFSLGSSHRLSHNESSLDLDTLSVQSFTMGTGHKRARSLVKVSSLASLLSPVSSVKKVGQALQRSMSFRSNQSANMTIKPYCKPTATPTKRRDSKLWSETVQGNINEALTKIQIKRQEAIFELYQGEVDLVDDLKLVMKTYRDSMRSLQMLSDEELNTIFGSLDKLRPLHEDLICQLQNQRRNDGTTEEVGKVLLKWLPTLTEVYISYCTNQLAAKTLLDEKKQDSKVNDFLERCLESPFSRKLDLWNFLDVPRSRLVKYPLLLKNILRLTPSEHEDKIMLSEAIKACEEIISEVDRRTGEMKCKHYINLLEYLDDRHRNPLIAFQKVLLCGGVLRNNKGTKLHVFLFEDILVVTRLATRNNRKCYQVHRQPIPVRTMVLEDIPDGEAKKSGSFRGALSHGQSGKCAFKVRSTDPNLSQSFTLFTSDEHDKKQWLQLFRSAMERARQDETCV